MSGYLLDTHALIWFLSKSNQLPEPAREQIRNESMQIYVSIASLWELSIKLRLGKIKLEQPLPDVIGGVTNSTFQLLPITTAHVLRVMGIPFHHRDHFDRMLIAQATEEGLTVISRDLAFDRYGVTRIWS